MSFVAQTKPGYRSGFVAIVGPANAGKSTLLNAVLGEKVSIVTSKPHTTRTRVLGVKTRDDGQLIFLDTPGFVRRSDSGELARFINSTISEVVSGVDLTMLVLDSSRLRGREGELKGIARAVEERGIPAPRVIVLNKLDLIEKDLLLPIIAECHRTFATDGQTIDILPVSARRKEGLVELESLLVSLLPEGPELFPADTLTDQTEATIAAEIVREKLFLELREELPYSVAVLVEGFREEGQLLRINAVILVERQSQKSIVVGARGTKLKAIGTAARLELEKLFNTHIYLELFVRVEPDWTRTKRGIARAGYGDNSRAR